MTLKKFALVEITFAPVDFEQLGSKEKFWFLFKQGDELEKWLFKFSRENTGEHWSEKIPEQLCKLLDIPHVNYELARTSGRIGVISKNIVDSDSRMVMGNEVLHSASPGSYPIPDGKRVRVREHTVSRVIMCLDNGVLPPITDLDIGSLNAGDIFCGYLMLDVLVSNQDRHHENWAIIVDGKGNRYLCPSYDHAASLGRELLDADRESRLSTKDKLRKVDVFVTKAKSEMFRNARDKKRLTTMEAFLLSVEGRSGVKEYWLSKLDVLTNDKIHELFAAIPDEVITPLGREFGIQMLIENKKRLLNEC